MEDAYIIIIIVILLVLIGFSLWWFNRGKPEKPPKDKQTKKVNLDPSRQIKPNPSGVYCNATSKNKSQIFQDDVTNWFGSGKLDQVSDTNYMLSFKHPSYPNDTMVYDYDYDKDTLVLETTRGTEIERATKPECSYL